MAATMCHMSTCDVAADHYGYSSEAESWCNSSDS
jgi:hypothetical protein